MRKAYLRLDVKFVEPLKTAARPAVGRRTKYYQFTAIDDCTRLRVLRIYPRCDQKTAIQFVDYVLERLPFPVRRVPSVRLIDALLDERSELTEN